MSRIIVDVRLLGKGGHSGIEEYTRNLVSQLTTPQSAHNYTLFYNGFRKAALPVKWETRPTVRVHTRRIPNKLFDISAGLAHVPNVERLTGEGDMVFSPHFNILATQLPHVITFHDLSFLHHPDFFSMRQRLWHMLQHYRKGAHRAAKIIAVSAFTKRDVVELLHVPEERVSVIHSGIHTDFRPLPPEDDGLRAFRETHGLNRPFVLYLGTVEPRKNVTAIIKAFEFLKQRPAHQELELVIAGSLGWLYGETLKAARYSPATKDIRFFGAVPAAERVYLYNLAQAFVYPSFFEGFGFQPLEAQACGTPVVASNRTSLPEILGSSALLVDPWRVRELADALSAILASGKEKLAEQGRQNAARFTWENAAQKTQDVFHDIMK